MRSLVLRRASVICDCGDCARAGVTRPSVELRATREFPQRWLHGVDLQRFLDEEARGSERVSEIAERLKADFGLRAQWGDEPR